MWKIDSNGHLLVLTRCNLSTVGNFLIVVGFFKILTVYDPTLYSNGLPVGNMKFQRDYWLFQREPLFGNCLFSCSMYPPDVLARGFHQRKTEGKIPSSGPLDMKTRLGQRCTASPQKGRNSIESNFNCIRKVSLRNRDPEGKKNLYRRKSARRLWIYPSWRTPVCGVKKAQHVSYK